MAVNKNFVVKNGLEVGTDIIVASVDNKNVGLGTTVGQVLLDVRGAIGATHLSVSGVGTIVTLNSTNLTGTAGTITTLTSTDSTITNGNITNGNITNLTGTSGTVTSFESTNGTITNLTGAAATITAIEATSGIFTSVTSTSGNITNGAIIYLTGTASTITNLTSTNLTGTAGTITNGTITNGTITNLTGTAATITTIEATNGSITNLTSTNINASGVITATSFVGDGSNLSNVGGYWVQNDAGIHTTASVGIGTTNPHSIPPSDNTSILNVGILTAYKLYGDGSALTGLAGNPSLQSILDTSNTSTTGMSITGVSTFTTAEVTNLTPTNINSSGVTTVTTLDVQTNFDVYDAQAVFHNDLYVVGNLSIGGTASSIITQDLRVEDADIILGVTTAPNGDDISNDTTANHGGIAVASTEGFPLVDLVVAGIETLPATYKKIMWFKSGTFSGLGTDAWLSNYAVGIGSTQFSTGTRLAVGGIRFTDTTATINTVNATNSTITNLTGTAGTITNFTPININATGVITATSFVGDGSGLSGAGSTVADDTTTNETFYPVFTQTTSGVITASKVSTTKFTFNPSTGEASATNFNSTSDESLKTNIHTVENSLDIVDQLRGVSFDWRENGKSSYGVIAQELEQVLPELVAQTDPKSVNYNGIIGVLIEAVKELKKEISDLKK